MGPTQSNFFHYVEVRGFQDRVVQIWSLWSLFATCSLGFSYWPWAACGRDARVFELWWYLWIPNIGCKTCDCFYPSPIFGVLSFVAFLKYPSDDRLPRPVFGSEYPEAGNLVSIAVTFRNRVSLRFAFHVHHLDRPVVLVFIVAVLWRVIL